MPPDAPSCPVCETSRIRPYLTIQGMELLCCDNCGLVFMRDMPDTRAIYDDFFDGATTGCHGFSPDSTRFRPDIDRNALKHQLWHPNNAYAQFGTCANTIGSRLAAGPTIGRGHIGGLHGFSVRPLQRGRECDGPDI